MIDSKVEIDADSEDFMVFETLSTTTESSSENQDGGNRELNRKIKNRSSKLGWTQSPSYTTVTSCSEAKKDCFQFSTMPLTTRPSIKLKTPLPRKSSGGTDLQRKKLNKSRSIKLKKPSTLRPKRPSICRFSQVHPNSDLSVERATCSSVLKNAKFPANIPEVQSETAVAKACTYSYCSLHGHRHGNSPQLKKVASIRRRATKTSKILKPENQSSVRAKDSGNRKRGSQVSATKHGLNKPADSPKTEMESQINNSRLWHLIYKHMVTGVATKGEIQSPTANVVDSTEAVEDIVESCSSQRDAIKLVQAAFDKILSEIPDNSSDDQSLANGETSDRKILLKKQDEEAPEISGLSDAVEDNTVKNPETQVKIEEDKEKQAEGNTSDRKLPKGWSNLKKVILLNKFVKALGKVRNIDPQKPRHLPMECDPEAEKVQLKRQTTLERKNAEEWMLDYALRQVISTLAPSQKKKVTLLVQAFETVIPSETEAAALIPTPARANTELTLHNEDGLQIPNDSEILLDSFPETIDLEDPGKSEMLEPVDEVTNFQEKVSVSENASNEFSGDTVSCLNFEDNKGGPLFNNLRAISSEPADDENRENNGLWSLIYQRLAANIETQPPINGEDSTENMDRGEFGSFHSITETDQVTGTEDTYTKSPKLELSKSNAVKLVREAFDKILSEIPDSSSDNQSNEGDVASDLELMSQKDDMGQEISTSSGSARDIVEPDSENSLTAEMEPKVPGNHTLKNWSRLKQVIVLKRFVTAMEKVRNFNPRKPQYLPMQQDSEPEKVTLRHQTQEERKKSDEMMLDYALRQVISSLAPSQKRKVALLVQAFETVGPLPETGLSYRSAVSSQTTPIQACHDSSAQNGDSTKCYNDSEISLGMKAVTEMSFQDAPDQDSDLSTAQALQHVQFPAFGSKIQVSDSECNIKKMEHGELTNVVNELPGKGQSPEEVNAGESIESGNNCTAKVETETSSEKQKHMKLWYLIYKHMASGAAAEDGVQSFGGGEGDSQEFSATVQNSADSRHKEESQMEVIKLVEEAIDEIPLPENQNDSSDDKSMTSDTVSVQDLQETIQGQGKEQLIPGFTVSAQDCSGESNTRVFDTGSIDNSSDPALVSDNISTQKEGKTMASVGKRMKPQAQKNWSNLKKLIILRRFVKAFEKVKTGKPFNPRGPNYLPVEPTQESEKVHLRRQDVGDRKNTEEWMLDCALQNVVAKLTPARKRRVQLLVEAFETVGPTFGS